MFDLLDVYGHVPMSQEKVFQNFSNNLTPFEIAPKANVMHFE